MIRKISADFIHTGDRGILNNHVLILDDNHTILDLRPLQDQELKDCEFFPGLITPGFINAHCHLELSHLKGMFDTGTKLIKFLYSVVSNRNHDPDIIQQHILDADREMNVEGIVAVGDICNTTDTVQQKQKSSIYYHSFIECFDFLQDQLAPEIFNSYCSVYDHFGDLPRSLTPHAPYSVSPELFRLISAKNASHVTSISIHNQESPEEDLLFTDHHSAYIDFWKSLGFSLDHFKPAEHSAIEYAMNHMDQNQRTLFVHNVCTKKDQVLKAVEWNPQSFFVSCPNANLFIENKLPEYQNLIDPSVKMCLGTDSLSSNWSLSILSEIKTILRYNSWLELDEIVKWACINGATALGIDDKYGSFSQNKKPGVNWIQDIFMKSGSLKLGQQAKVFKLA